MQAQSDEGASAPSALADDLIEGAAAAADFLGPAFNRRKVYRLTEDGHLPAIRMGTRIFYRKSELERAFQATA